MPPRTKTLLEALADLSSTAPEDFDPERAGGEAVGLGQESDAEEENEGGREHYVSVGYASLCTSRLEWIGKLAYLRFRRGKLRNQIGFDLDDPKYAGKRVSRKTLYEDDGQEDDEDEDGDEDGDEEGSESLDGSDEDEMDMDGFENMEGSQSDAADSELGGEEGEDDESDESDEEGGEAGSDDDDGEADTQARLAKELAQLEMEEKKLVKSMSASAKADTDKGKHVRAQIVRKNGS